MRHSVDKDVFIQALSLAPVAVVMLDENRHITFWNAEATKLFGCQPEEAIGQDFISRYASEQERRGLEAFIRFHEELPNSRFERIPTRTRLITAQGLALSCHLHISQIKLGDKTTYCIYIRPDEEASAPDRKLVVENDYLRKIIDRIPLDIAIFDADHRYLYLNRKAIRNDALREYIIGKDDFQYMAHTGRDPSIAILRRQWFNKAKESRALQSWEDPIVDGEGNKFISLRNFYPVMDDHDELKFMIGYGVDITERKRMEELISNINQELEVKVQERTQELKKANEDLDAFNTMVSHDLQSPIRTLSGFSQLLKHEYHDKLDEQGKEFLDLLDQGAKSMSQLIKGLLQFSRLGKANLTLIHVDMNELVSDVIHEVRMSYPATHPQLIIKTLPAADCDIVLIRQVWLNLISNSFKYSGKQKEPQIEIGHRTANGERHYYVKDNGIGFDKKYSEKLFKMFQRLHNGFEYEGTGVGLAIVKRIVEKHRGRIWFESLPGEGATFYFTIGDQ